jgi:two-component system, NtrC family, response regulator AtoC
VNETILLADDDDSVRHALSRVLESEHYRVMPARNGDEAVARFLEELPNLVLLDLNMPGKDGWEAYRIMKRLDPMVPVIVVTARPHQFVRAVELGVDALMEKPLDLPVLFSAIADLISEPKAERPGRLANRTSITQFLAHGLREACC